MGSDSHKKDGFSGLFLATWAGAREHSLSYVTGVVTKHDCMDAGAVAVSA